MALLANLNTFLTLAFVVIFSIVILGMLLKKMKQPYIIGYILVGILVGDSGFGLIQNS